MAVRNISVRVTANTRSLEQGLARAQQLVAQFGTTANANNLRAIQTYTQLAAAMQRAGQAAGPLASANVRIDQSTRNVTQTVNRYDQRIRSTVTTNNRHATSIRNVTNNHINQAAAVGRVASAYAALGAVMGTAVGGVALAAVLRTGVDEALKFEVAMRNVNSLMQETDEVFYATGDAVLQLSRELPQSAVTLAEGLYDVTSSGFAGAEGLEVLEASAQAASAGMSDTATAARTITAVLNAYGLEAEDAGDVSDILFSTVDKGVIEFNQLANVLGQVVGASSAAKIPIEDVGAAIATMTLAGQNAFVAGTSLSNLIRKIVDPTAEMAAVYKELGYSSGEAALQQKGLVGITEDLRRVTGGSLSQLITLTGDMEATRALTALMSQDGALYSRIQGELADANARRGATERALAEQLKAASAQLQLFGNRAKAASTEIGYRVLPVFTAFLTGAQELAADALPGLVDQGTRLLPFLTSMRNVGADVVSILTDLYRTAQPAAKAIGGLAYSAVVGVLTLFGNTLEAVTGFLADHTDVLIAAAAVIAGLYLRSLIQITVASGAVVIGIVQMQVASFQAGGGFTALATSATAAAGAISLANVAVSALTIGLSGALLFALYNYQKAAGEARENTAELTKGFDALDSDNAAKQIANLKAAMEDGISAYSDYVRAGADFEWLPGTGSEAVMGGLYAIDQILGTERGKAAAGLDEYRQALERLQAQTANTQANLEEASRRTGVSIDELTRLAQAENIDLTSHYETNAEGLDELVDRARLLGEEIGVSTQQVDTFLANFTLGAEELAKVIAEVQDAVSGAFTGATDVLGTYKPGEGTDQLIAAQERLADATERLDEKRADAAASTEVSTSAARDLARAERDVASAQEDVAAAQRAVEDGTLEGYYARAVTMAQNFTANLQRAAEMGLDTGALVKLMQEGPEQAGPILEQIVGDSTGRMVELVNTSEAELARLNEQVVAQARLTALAVNSTNDQLVRDLGTAMEITRLTMASETGMTAEAIARAIGIPPEEVLRVASEYGITIGQQINAGIQATVKAPRLTVDRDSSGNPIYSTGGRSGGPKMSAEGGPVIGPGGPKQDLIPHLLSNGEWVQPAAAVSHYGPAFMEAVRTRRLPRPIGLADGGPAGGFGPGAYAPAASGVSVVTVPVTTTVRNERPINVGTVMATDVGDFERQAERRRRLHAMTVPTG